VWPKTCAHYATVNDRARSWTPGDDATYRGVVTTPGDPGRTPDDGHLPSQGQAGYGAAQEPPYVYNPYANVAYPSTYPSTPAGLGGAPMPEAPARRPGSVHLALVLLVLSALPYLLFGLAALLVADQSAGALPPDDLAELQRLGVDPAQLVRTGGTVMLVIAGIFLLLAILAWMGRRWARALVITMTAGFVLMVIALVAAAGSQGLPVDNAALLLLALPVVLALGGVALLLGSAARRWFSRPRG
jgi:hypothetical protein